MRVYLITIYSLFILEHSDRRCEIIEDGWGEPLLEKPCLFPFTYQDKCYNRCILNHNITSNPINYGTYVCPTQNQFGKWYEDGDSYGVCEMQNELCYRLDELCSG